MPCCFPVRVVFGWVEGEAAAGRMAAAGTAWSIVCTAGGTARVSVAASDGGATVTGP